MIITRTKLCRAPFENVARLARSLGIPAGCECIICRERTIESVARACEIDDVARIIGGDP